MSAAPPVSAAPPRRSTARWPSSCPSRRDISLGDPTVSRGPGPFWLSSSCFLVYSLFLMASPPSPHLLPVLCFVTSPLPSGPTSCRPPGAGAAAACRSLRWALWARVPSSCFSVPAPRAPGGWGQGAAGPTGIWGFGVPGDPCAVFLLRLCPHVSWLQVLRAQLPLPARVPAVVGGCRPDSEAAETPSSGLPVPHGGPVTHRFQPGAHLKWLHSALLESLVPLPWFPW